MSGMIYDLLFRLHAVIAELFVDLVRMQKHLVLQVFGCYCTFHETTSFPDNNSNKDNDEK